MVDLTDSDSVRDKRRKTRQAWASRKDKEMQEMQETWDRMDRRDEETLGLIRDIVNAISSPTILTPPANIPSSSHASSSTAIAMNTPSTHSVQSASSIEGRTKSL